MKILKNKRCVIGEGPIYNVCENMLYFTNGMEKEICTYDFSSEEVHVIRTEKSCVALTFDTNNRIIVSCSDGIFRLNPDTGMSLIYDSEKYEIKNANDMKAGPDGRIYVGTQSSKRLGLSDKADGKLYCIDKDGNVKILLDNLLLSNGMEWSLDEKLYYHTDSDTQIIKEYFFDGDKGEIAFTGREIRVPGADGFTIGRDGSLYVACWGRGHIARIDTKMMKTAEYIKLPCKIPASCCFAGERMDKLVITTASLNIDMGEDKNAGLTIIMQREGGRPPYLFGEKV